MKKIISFILLLSLMLTACGTSQESSNYLANPMFETEEYLEAYDAKNDFLSPLFPFVETEDAYYFCSDDGYAYINYYDKSSGLSDKLCAKPECSHDNKDCNAYVGSSCFGLFEYDGKLFWLSNALQLSSYDGILLYSSDLDGTNRREVLKFPNEFLSNYVNPVTVLHRGYFYSTNTMGIINGGVQYNIVQMAAQNLDGSDELCTIFEKEYSTAEYRFPHCSVYYVGNDLYFAIGVYAVDSDENGNETYIGRQEFYKIDLITRDLTILYDGESNYIPYNIVVKDGILYFTGIDDYAEILGAKIFALDINSKEITEICELSKPQEEYLGFRISVSDNYITAGYTKEPSAGKYVNEVEVLDYSGKTIYSGVVDFPETSGLDMPFVSFIGTDGNDLLWRIEGGKGDLFFSLPLDGSDGKVLYSTPLPETGTGSLPKPNKGK